jgi:hypothetical protein
MGIKKKKLFKKKKPAVKKKIRKTASSKKTPKAVKKAVARKSTAKKTSPKKSKVALKSKEDVVGIITHYFPKVRAAVVKLNAPLSSGESIKIKGHTTDFVQTANSMQLDHQVVNSAKKGQEIGLQVNSRVRQHDIVIRQK